MASRSEGLDASYHDRGAPPENEASTTTAAARIDQLDILRGIAILGILFINLPGAATYFVAFFGLQPLAGWSDADQATWIFLRIFFEDTQRGLLQLLFGAGMIILTAKAMRNDGPVAVADNYFRRNLWLLVFGLANVFLLLFPGDILFIYAIAALLIFPFRRLGPKALLAIGLSWTIFWSVAGIARYAERQGLEQRIAVAVEKRDAGSALAPEEAAALTTWSKLQKGFQADPSELAKDRAKRLGPFVDYAKYMHEVWIHRAADLEIFFISVPEAFAVMLIGAALFKWRILQGGRTRRFYLLLTLTAYAIGVTLRIIEVEQHLDFDPQARLRWISRDISRLAMTAGHVGAVSLLLKTDAGTRLLAPLKAAGRTAFSLYLMQSILVMWILFPGFGFGLWGRFGWAGMTAISLAIIAVQIILANVWLRYFSIGPVEWLWRSLTHMQRQPLRKPPVRLSQLPA